MQALRYLGGKSEGSSTGVGAWIASLLPYRNAYIEPFSGMLGVLLQRMSSPVEIANDIDDRIVSWWRAIRDYPDDFAWLIENTPHSRKEFNDASVVLADDFVLDDATDKSILLRKALQTHIYLSQNYASSLYSSNTWLVSVIKRQQIFDGTNVMSLRERIKDVMLECCDVIDILDRYKDEKDIVVYCDPPYSSTSHKRYKYGYNKNDFSDIVKKQKGFISISGYDDEWDHLDSYSCSKDIQTRIGVMSHGKASNKREVLWANQPLEAQIRLFC